MGGKNFFPRGCAATSARISAWPRAWRAFTMFMARGELGSAGAKKPGGICRKVIEAKVSGKHEIEIWGSGVQTRSFMFIDDCTDGIQKIMSSEILSPSTWARAKR